MVRQYEPEIQARVIAEWKAGSSLNQLAREFKIPKSTIQGWAEAHPRTMLVPKQNPLANYDLDGMAVELLDGSLGAIRAIQRAPTDEAWLKRQDAQQLAILYGVISDKLYRLLGAIRREDEPA